MSISQPLRWGIMGCARISRRGLIPGIRASESSSIQALASRTLGTAEAWAKEFGIPRAWGSYEELLTDPEVDAVYIPLPNELHKQWVFAAADAGKHVLCEKPLALNLEDAREMVARCESRGVLLMEAFMWRHQPRTAGVLEIVRKGTIGELRLVRSSFSFSIDADDWRLDPARGGGALWDVGCYGVSTARLFAGAEPESIRSRARFGPTGVDLSLTAELKFPDGVIGLIDCSFEQPFRCVYELVGTLGAIEVPDAFLPPEKPTARVNGNEVAFPGADQYGKMVDHFATSVEKGGGPAAPGETGLAQMTVLDKILTEARAV